MQKIYRFCRNLSREIEEGFAMNELEDWQTKIHEDFKSIQDELMANEW